MKIKRIEKRGELPEDGESLVDRLRTLDITITEAENEGKSLGTVTLHVTTSVGCKVGDKFRNVTLKAGLDLPSTVKGIMEVWDIEWEAIKGQMSRRLPALLKQKGLE